MLACTRLALHKGKDMSVIEVGDKFNCDCGFSWKRGQSGSHSCGDGLRKQIYLLKKELSAANEIMGGQDATCKLLFEAKNYWADRARLAEKRIAEFGAETDTTSSQYESLAGGK
ncbi:hypothetical protein PSNIH1_00685 [Pantoea sp. PSNIH1]|nr:hypothetical protein PSNIH1_00685 [Pantoea sp. PSNIH1]